MRFDTSIYFVSTSGKHYDLVAGEWIVGQPEKVKRYANVTHMGAQRQQAVFGDVQADRLVVRLQRAYTVAYDHVEIAGFQSTPLNEGRLKFIHWRKIRLYFNPHPSTRGDRHRSYHRPVMLYFNPHPSTRGDFFAGHL